MKYSVVFQNPDTFQPLLEVPSYLSSSILCNYGISINSDIQVAIFFKWSYTNEVLFFF